MKFVVLLFSLILLGGCDEKIELPEEAHNTIGEIPLVEAFDDFDEEPAVTSWMHFGLNRKTGEVTGFQSSARDNEKAFLKEVALRETKLLKILDQYDVLKNNLRKRKIKLSEYVKQVATLKRRIEREGLGSDYSDLLI